MNKKSKVIIIVISLIVGGLHFVISPAYKGIASGFVTGYLMDILLPMNLYLLFQISFRQKTSVRMSRIFAVLFTLIFASWVEFLQYKGISFLGNTYDTLDLFMYAIGVSLGLLIDFRLLERYEAKS